MLNIKRLNNQDINFKLGCCKLNNSKKKFLRKNPHCTEYFCNINNYIDCTNCFHYLKDKIMLEDIVTKDVNINQTEIDNDCKSKCADGYFFSNIIIPDCEEQHRNTYNIDKYKTINNFYVNTKITRYDHLPYVVDYENTLPKPKTTVHWGQLKMLLVTILFFNKVVTEKDKNVHVIYAGSASGDNILIMIKMFPNIIWHLVDPRPHNRLLYKSKNVKSITKEYFTDELAVKFGNEFKNRKHKLLFMSDIREGTEDEKVLHNQESNIKWHLSIKPDYSYLKFRCGYETDKNYEYYYGKIYLQIYAPQSSTETRLLLKKDIVPHTYDTHEYQGKMLYFNRVIRPGYHKRLINKNDVFDNCYDCVYFSKIIYKYIKKFPNFNPFDFDKTDKKNFIYLIMMYILKELGKTSSNKLFINNKIIRNNLI